MDRDADQPLTKSQDGRPVATDKTLRRSKLRQPNLRALFWKWHLYAGLLGGPLLVFIAVTGAILVFGPEIDHWLRHDLWAVTPPSGDEPPARMTDQALVDIVRHQFPDSELVYYNQSKSPNLAYQFLLRKNGSYNIWVNPYTGDICGERKPETTFVSVVTHLHRRLLSGEFGRSIVELITGWGIVLTLTGLFLWWPKTWKALRQGLTLTFRGSAYKVNWRLHNVIGAWTALFVLLMCVTGMVFSTYAGANYRAIQGAWKIPETNSTSATQVKSPVVPDGGTVSVDDLIAVVREQISENAPLLIQLPQSRTNHFDIWSGLNLRPQWSDWSVRESWRFDRSGQLISRKTWKDQHPMQRLWNISQALHYGSILGTPTKLIAFVSCLAVPLLSVTGYLIWWWKRQGKKKLKNRPATPAAASAFDQSPPISQSLVACLIVVGIIFPTIGASFIALLLWESLCYVVGNLWRRFFKRSATGEDARQGRFQERIFSVHGWLGLSLGLPLFIICLSGTLAVVSHEIDWLVTPAMRVPVHEGPVNWEAIAENVRQRYPDDRITRFQAPEMPGFAAQAWVQTSHGIRRIFTDPATGTLTGEAGWLTVRQFFRDFHRQFFWQSAWGTTLVSSFACLLLLSTGAGLLYCTRWEGKPVTQDWGVLRSGLSRSTGIGTLVFAGLISMTGMWFLCKGPVLEWLNKPSRVAATRTEAGNSRPTQNREVGTRSANGESRERRSGQSRSGGERVVGGEREGRDGNTPTSDERPSRGEGRPRRGSPSPDDERVAGGEGSGRGQGGRFGGGRGRAGGRQGTSSSAGAGPVTAMLPVAEYVRIAQEESPAMTIHSVSFPESPGAPVEVSGQATSGFTTDGVHTVRIDPHQGNIVSVQKEEELSASIRWSHIADSLHFGRFGGLASKLVWFAFGLLVSGLIPIGLYLWLRRAEQAAIGVATRSHDFPPCEVAREIRRATHRWTGLGFVATTSILALAAVSTYQALAAEALKSSRTTTPFQEIGPWKVLAFKEAPSSDSGNQREFGVRFSHAAGIPNFRQVSLAFTENPPGDADWKVAPGETDERKVTLPLPAQSTGQERLWVSIDGWDRARHQVEFSPELFGKRPGSTTASPMDWEALGGMPVIFCCAAFGIFIVLVTVVWYWIVWFRRYRLSETSIVEPRKDASILLCSTIAEEASLQSQGSIQPSG